MCSLIDSTNLNQHRTWAAIGLLTGLILGEGLNIGNRQPIGFAKSNSQNLMQSPIYVLLLVYCLLNHFVNPAWFYLTVASKMSCQIEALKLCQTRSTSATKL